MNPQQPDLFAPLSAPFLREKNVSRRSFLTAGSAMLALHAAKLRAANPAGAHLPDPLASPCFATSQTSYPPMLARFIERLDPATDVFPSEVYVAQIERILASWSAALRASSTALDAIQAVLADQVQATSFVPFSTTAFRKQPPLQIERRSFPPPTLQPRETFLHNLHAYLSTFASLQTVELQIYGTRITGNSPLTFETELRADLVGTTHTSEREQRVGAWHITWQHDSQKQWRIHSFAADAETCSRLAGPGFTEMTGHCLDANDAGMAQLIPGIDHWRSALDGASGIDVYGNHGIAVGDIDGSGYDSFYVCQPSGLPNRLYRNRGDGTFQDITETSGVGILDGTASALFADFQNRGKQDLLVVRTGGPLLFTNLGNGRFDPRPDAFQFARPPQGTFTSAAIADYDRDGFLDIYFCVYSYYQGLNQYAYPSPYYDAQNGPPNFLFRNRGDGTFEDVTVSSGMDQNNNRYSFAVAWCDFDNDGWPDLYVANDFGRKNLYRNSGAGKFTDIAAQAGVEDYGPGMSTCWLDHDNDGNQDVYVANMWLPEGKRITADDHFLPGVDPAIRALYQKHNAGNSLYRNNGKGAFENETADAGASMGRWSWSCASWDFDNDGWSDLYVANGFVSGANPQDLQSFFWRQIAQRSMTPAGASPEYELAWNAVNELVRSDYSWSGYQRNVFLSNNHDGTFSDISGVLGLDLVDDSRAFALADFDHDGRFEFVLKNRTSPQLRLLHNDMVVAGASIIVRLTGVTSNRDAIGASVTIESGATRQTKFVCAGSGFASQHTKELHFGLGDASGPIDVSVRWPTGKVDHYNALPVDHRVAITEGEPKAISTAYKTTRPLAAAPLAQMSAPSTIATWLVAPLFGPDLQLADQEGKPAKLSDLRPQPTLLTFLKKDCGDSKRQWTLLQNKSAELASAEIALYVVALDGAHAAEFSAASVPIYFADERALGAWNIQYRYLYDRRRDMQLPLSCLIDREGAVIRIYQGVAEPQAVIHDWQTAPTAEQRFARAMPFTGPYYGGPMKHDYLTFGIAFAEYNYVDEAQSAFQHAIDANPTQQGAWFNLGTIYLNKKMYPEARKYLSEAVRLNAQDADAWNNLGMLSGEEQKYDEALDQFRHAALANPDHLLAVENMMRIYRFQGRAADAQNALTELIVKAPNNADLHLALAMALIAQSELQQARMELETSLRLRPDNAEALNNLGALLLRLGLPAEALIRFEQSRKLNPDFDRPCINAAMLYSSEGQSPRARDLLASFLATHPDNNDVRAALAKLGPQ